MTTSIGSHDPRIFARARKIAVVGSGTAGLFAALALKRARPALEVAIIASPTIPVIGVGEATTPPLVSFLHGFLGVDVGALFAAVRPTFKLGIRFDWGAGERGFHYAFGGGDLASAFAHEGHARDYSLTSLLMSAHKGPLFREGESLRSLLSALKFAYHLDNAPFVAFLESVAASRGISFVRATVVDVRKGDDGVEAVVLEGGELAHYDAWIDATGFRSQLLGGALEVPFESYASSLYCDAAVVGNGPHGATGPAPYTRATTMSSGWCWTIPTRAENHYGYVFSHQFTTPDEAEAELRARFDIVGKTRLVRFRSGRRERLIHGNVAAIGNAYGFVEPLESTALHMAIATALRVAGLASGARDDPEIVSREIGDQWDYLRGFLAVHYRYNERSNSPFWQHCRSEVDLGPLHNMLDDYEAGPIYTQRRDVPSFVRDTVFGARGLDLLLLGQGRTPKSGVCPDVDADAWSKRKRDWESRVSTALSHADTLDAIAEDKALRADLQETGWIPMAAIAMRKIAMPPGRPIHGTRLGTKSGAKPC